MLNCLRQTKDTIMKIIHLSLSILSATLLLAACGGGSGTGVTTTSVPTGLAAVGAPISAGTLSAIDVNGLTASTSISNDGTYSIDFLTTLRPPILLRAEGVSGGRTTVHFGVITRSTDTTVNVNPVSTAVVAQVLQADPGVVFANADITKIALLTSAQVSAANNIIGSAMSAARTAAGLAANSDIDFLNTPFAADKTGLDKLLDLVKISVQPDRTVQLKNKTSDGVATVSLSGTVSGALGTIESIDTRGIDTLGRAIQAAFQNGAQPWSSASQSVIDLFSASFLHGGKNRLQTIADIAREAEDMRGSQFLPAKVLNCSIVNASPVCEVLFTVKYTDGGFEPFIFPVRLEGGAWKMYGDQAPVYTEYGAVVYRTVAGDNSPVTRSGFNINIYDDASINGVNVGYAKVWFGTDTSGAAEFTLVNPAVVNGSCNGRSLGYLEKLSIPTNLNSCEGNFATLSDARIDSLRATFAVVRPKITVRYYDVNGNSISNAQHVITVEALPLKPNEVDDGYFATITNTSWNQFAAANLEAEFTLTVNKGATVGLEDVVGAGPIGSSLSTQNLPFTTVRTGNSWRALKANSYLITVTRDADGRMYWYQRQPAL